MKKLFLLTFALLSIGFFNAANAQPTIGKIDQNPNIKIDPNVFRIVATQQTLNDYADKLEVYMKNRSVGYQFTVVSNGVLAVSRAGGDARRAPDANPRKMTADDKFNVASVSKTITAAAVLKLLNQKGISVDAPVYPYLPSSWKLGDKMNTVTFRQLLTHRSGIRCDQEVTYVNVKACVEKGFGIKLVEQKYNNTNYALFRMIIPILNGFKDGALKDDKTASIVFAGLYADYVQNNVFKPLGLNGIELKPIAANPGLAYQYPSPVIAGDSFGDMQETSASRGWNMNSKQLATFINGLLYTEKVLPKTVSAQMKKDQLGLWQAMNGSEVVDYEHGGYYPGKNDTGGLYNQGEMNTLIAAFPNGISVAVIVNSQYGPNWSVASSARLAMSQMKK